jgi:hypothetical protein
MRRLEGHQYHSFEQVAADVDLVGGWQGQSSWLGDVCVVLLLPTLSMCTPTEPLHHSRIACVPLMCAPGTECGTGAQAWSPLMSNACSTSL